MKPRQLTVFAGPRAVASGPEAQIIPVLTDLQGREVSQVLIFDDRTGEQVDVDWRSPQPAAEPEPARPGRPKLGVVAREVTLLPRHWEWLNAQPGGASVALRKLVEAARRENAEGDRIRASQEATFRFISAIAGNEPGFEEASRSLFAGDRAAFEARTAEWPEDVATYARELSTDAFGGGAAPAAATESTGR